MVLADASELSEPFSWPGSGVTRVPFRLFSDPEIYALEQQRIFRGRVWNYLCLEIDIPNPGDFKTTFIGETPIVVIRDENGDINALVNRCAHKGALVCLQERGNKAKNGMTCVYHSWTYDLRGQLKGIAFRNGIRARVACPMTSTQLSTACSGLMWKFIAAWYSAPSPTTCRPWKTIWVKNSAGW